MDSLSPDVLAKIAYYLPGDAIFKLERTAKSLHSLISNDKFWAALSSEKLISSEILHKFGSFKTYLKVATRSKFIRFRVLATRKGAMPQLSQIKFVDENRNAIAPVKATSEFPARGEPESATNLINTYPQGKWYSGQNAPKYESMFPFPFQKIRVDVTFEFSKMTNIAECRLITANDCPERDPTEWIWEVPVSKNKKGEMEPCRALDKKCTWLELHKTSASPTTGRYKGYANIPIFTPYIDAVINE